MEVTANDTHKLYEASMRGCVVTLNTLIQKDPYILHKISLTSFNETPLHISALYGRLDVTKALLSLKPQLVTELDSYQRSPLHLASAEGHTEIVKELLLVNNDVCLVADQEGRIPLHLAAMRGRVEVIQELVSAKPQSVHVKVLHDHEDTVFHLCVRYNHLDALKLLVESIDDEEFLNSENHQGKTILQLSAMLKQLETICYLLSLPQIRVEDVKSLMESGSAALDNLSLDVKNENKILQAITSRNSNNQSTQSATTPDTVRPTSGIQKIFEYLRRLDEGLYEERGQFMVVVTVLASLNFQVGLNTPGGLWQEDINNNTRGCPEGVKCKAGTSIISYTHPWSFIGFFFFNSLSFISSMIVILFLVLRAPLKSKFLWVPVVMYMVFAIFSTVLSYFILLRSINKGSK